MANITFVNNTAPVGGLSYNPGLEEVLDATGTLGGLTSKLFEVINNEPGAFNGYKVQFTSNANGGAGDFTYLFSPNGPLEPHGTITGVTVRAPNGTIILEVTPGATGFDDQKLDHFFTRLINPAAESPSDAALSALGNLLRKVNLIQGSSIADHATAIGTNGTQVLGGLGNDTLSSTKGYREAEFSGAGGNDVIRVADGKFQIHGANADGSGGSGETNTLEIRGYHDHSSYAVVDKVTDIDVLRFTDVDAGISSASNESDMEVVFLAGDIGAGRLSPTLAVQGSATTSPFSYNEISINAVADPTATKGVTIDLSKWTFSGWDADHGQVRIHTSNGQKPLNDTVVGSKVNDYIDTGYGDDVIRGGSGADNLYGGGGNDTFVYGANEAAPDEYIAGGDDRPRDGSADRFLILGDNDFTKAEFYGVEQLAFGGTATATFNQYFIGEYGISTVVGDSHANTLAVRLVSSSNGPSAIDLSDLAFKSWSTGDVVSIVGTKALDTIAGSAQGDVINGGLGSDNLQGNGGADTFVFDVGFGKGVDHIADFHRKEGDTLELTKAAFAKLKLGELSKGAFATGDEAHDRNDRIIYDKKDGVVRYDDDGSGKHAAHIIAILDDAASLKHGDIFVI